jgi:SAM-dependent methyltransferase
MRLLDAGCGAGSITIGLAKAVSPGQVTGVDIDAISLSVAHDAASGVSNLRFELADIAALPFDGASFDACFVHAVLQHVESPAAALAELRRVLRPGGVIGVADADFGGAIIWPSNAALVRWSEILSHTRRHPRIGKELRVLLNEAGFVRTEAFVAANARGNANLTRLDGEFWSAYFEAEEFIAHAVASGWSTREELQQIAAALRAWGENPGAFSAAFWCQASNPYRDG